MSGAGGDLSATCQLRRFIMSKIYAMSDIHGCLMEFEEALSLVDLTGDNKLVLLGDYIHGGPDPFGVLKG